MIIYNELHLLLNHVHREDQALEHLPIASKDAQFVVFIDGLA